jgi:anti-sigma factor RsiW
MNCDAVINRMTAWLDGELTKAECAAFESHLASCPSCSQEVRGRSDIREFVQSWKVEPNSTDLWPAVARKVSSGEPRRPVLAILRTAAVVLLGLAIGMAGRLWLYPRPSVSATERDKDRFISQLEVTAFDDVTPGSLAHTYSKLTLEEEQR